MSKLMPADGPEVLGFKVGYGQCLTQVGKYAEAEVVLRECLAIRRKQAPGAWTTFNTVSLLGEALAGQGKDLEAERLLTDGYAGLKRTERTIPPAYRRQRLQDAIDRLVRFYEAVGKSAEAARWRAEYSTLPPEPAPPPRPAGR
jgi:serine/threonine-protein kinase